MSVNFSKVAYVGTDNLSWPKEKEEIDMKWKSNNIMHGGTQNEGVAESSCDIPYGNWVTTHSFSD